MFKLGKALVSATVFVFLLTLCVGFAYADSAKVGVITGDTVNMREASDTSSKVLIQLTKGTQVTIISESNGWYKATYKTTTGWISGQYVSVKDSTLGTGTITGENVNVRSEAGLSAKVLTKVDDGDQVTVYSHSGSWYKIKTPNGTVGWVFDDFVSLKSSSVSRGDDGTSLEETPSGDASIGQQMVTYAKKFLGVKYVYGGNSPSQGFDCSGFTTYVYSHFGYKLNRVAADQAKQGTKVSKSDLQLGDLVLFDTNGGHNAVNHVGIYIGNGNFIHASSGSRTHKVTISQLDDDFYANAFMTARRIIK